MTATKWRHYKAIIIITYISAVRGRETGGLERELKMTGAQWKKLIKKAMPIAKKRGDISNFDKIVFSVFEDKVKIKANRYSALKCYKDDGYYMVIKLFKNKDQIFPTILWKLLHHRT